jgi:ASC-1-like (ASCH) protein
MMGSKLIKLGDGTLIEVVTAGDEVQQISGGDKINATFDKIKPIVLKTCMPIVESVEELRDKVGVEQVEVEIGLSFTAEGNIYITKTTISANVIIRMTLKHKE